MQEKRRQRSVGIQHTGYFDQDNQNGSQTARLSKKSGFRNLLNKSVTIVSKDSEEQDSLHASRDRRTKAIQATFSDGSTSQRQIFREQNLELTLSRRPSSVQVEEPKTTSEVMTVAERGAETARPGPSGMTEMFSATSVPSQENELHFRRDEGSLAVVYSFGEKSTQNSVSSNLAFYYGSQGSRRFSDETVLLIEDYQSYDQVNAARRQRNNLSDSNPLSCCWKREDPALRPEFLTRPLPLLEYEALREKEEVVCRICHEGDDVEPLIQPCLCKGSVGSVHAKCLKIWLEQSSTSRCELCNYPYAIRQTKKYTKCVSIRVFYKTIIDRSFIGSFIDRALAYDVISFVIITPLTLVGVVMCIQASLFSPGGASESNFQMGYITKIGMTMLSGTIMVAYLIWLYTLLSFHYKSWRKWYSNCFDVEVIPVRMTSEERLLAARRLSEEMARRQLSSEQGSTLVTYIHSPHNYSFYQRRLSVVPERGW